MKLKKLIVGCTAAVLIAGLVACGGSDSGSTAPASGSAKYVTGPITAFGSVYINGTKYETDGASVYVEGSQASQSDLRVGMMVSAKVSNGKAESIHFSDDLEGFAIGGAVVDGSTITLNVMGQTVVADSLTIFESKVPGITTAADIVDGNIVEVSGSSDAAGKITATRLEVKAVDLTEYLLIHPEGVEVKGVVASHNSVAETFNIGSLVVSYATANLDDMPVGSWDGLYVEVKSVKPLEAGQLVASKVELENEGAKGHHGEENDEVEVAGEVSELTASSVTVNGQTFLLDADTKYDDGTIAELVLGAMVKVEGHVNSDGDLVASEIEFDHDEADDEIKGAVESVTATSANEGTIVVNGISIVITTGTIMHDSGPHHEKSFNLSMLAVDDVVEVDVIDNGDGTFTAIKLERKHAIPM